MNDRKLMPDDMAHADSIPGPGVGPRSDKLPLDELHPQGSQRRAGGGGGRSTRQRIVSERENKPACSGNAQVDHGKVARFGSAMAPFVDVGQPSTQFSETDLQQTETGIGRAVCTEGASPSCRSAGVPGVAAIEARAEFLAGWAAGQAAAAACGPLSDEIARNVVLILETTTPASASPRRPC